MCLYIYACVYRNNMYVINIILVILIVVEALADRLRQPLWIMGVPWVGRFHLCPTRSRSSQTRKRAGPQCMKRLCCKKGSRYF